MNNFVSIQDQLWGKPPATATMAAKANVVNVVPASNYLSFAKQAESWASRPLGPIGTSLQTKPTFLSKLWTSFTTPMVKTAEAFGQATPQFVAGAGQSLTDLMLQKMGLTPQTETVNTQGQTETNYNTQEEPPRGSQPAFTLPDWLMFWRKSPDADSEPAGEAWPPAGTTTIIAIIGIAIVVLVLLTKK